MIGMFEADLFKGKKSVCLTFLIGMDGLVGEIAEVFRSRPRRGLSEPGRLAGADTITLGLKLGVIGCRSEGAFEDSSELLFENGICLV